MILEHRRVEDEKAQTPQFRGLYPRSSEVLAKATWTVIPAKAGIQN
jgi:hypothetical protein